MSQYAPSHRHDQHDSADFMAPFNDLWRSYLVLHSSIMGNLTLSLQGHAFHGRVLVLEPRMDLGWGNILPVVATAAIAAMMTNRALLVRCEFGGAARCC